jgi:hypothetical protein
MVLHPVGKYPEFCEMHITIATFRTAHKFYLSWPILFQSTSSRKVFWTSVLILFFLLWLCRGWRTYVMRAQNITQNNFHGTWHSLLSLIYFFCLTSPSTLWRICVYTHISDCIEIVFGLPLLTYSTAMNHFYTNQGQCEVLTGCLSLSAWRWTGKYVTLDGVFYNLFFQQEAVAVPNCLPYTLL